MKYKKPEKLKLGDTIAIISPSWGGPSTFPQVYEKGIENIKDLGFKVKEFPNTKADAKFLHDNPKARADDLNSAFNDKDVNGIIATIGGDDSVRILPFLNKEIAINNPKLLMGYSDTTILTTFYNNAGLVTFNGPVVMSGFAQMESLSDQFTKHIKDFFFGDTEDYEYLPYSLYSDGYPSWSDENNAGKVNKLKSTDGWHWLQGNGIVQGELFGGCIEVLEFLKGTDFWFSKDLWNNKILFFETSEEKPTVSQIKYMLRNYGMQNVFSKVNAVLFGRARDYTDEEKTQLDKIILSVIQDEFGSKNLTVVTNMDFGHTDPQIILPLGVKVELNNEDKTFKLKESPFK